MLHLLEVLRGWPDIDADELSQQPEWAQAQAWGWIMRTGELTGSGLRHVHDLPGGIIVEQVTPYRR
jgi:hypothetical protein